MFLALLAGPFATAHADVYKCVGHDGKISFASTPCGPEKGAASWQNATKRTRLKSVVAEDAIPKNINERATKILQADYRTKIDYKVIIVPPAVEPKQ